MVTSLITMNIQLQGKILDFEEPLTIHFPTQYIGIGDTQLSTQLKLTAAQADDTCFCYEKPQYSVKVGPKAAEIMTDALSRAEAYDSEINPLVKGAGGFSMGK